MRTFSTAAPRRPQRVEYPADLAIPGSEDQARVATARRQAADATELLVNAVGVAADRERTAAVSACRS